MPPIDLTTQPHYVSDPRIGHLITAMRAAHRSELIHYAGACYRDPVAWQMVLAWVADPHASEALLKSRALKALEVAA